MSAARRKEAKKRKLDSPEDTAMMEMDSESPSQLPSPTNVSINQLSSENIRTKLRAEFLEMARPGAASDLSLVEEKERFVNRQIQRIRDGKKELFSMFLMDSFGVKEDESSALFDRCTSLLEDPQEMRSEILQVLVETSFFNLTEFLKDIQAKQLDVFQRRFFNVFSGNSTIVQDKASSLFEDCSKLLPAAEDQERVTFITDGLDTEYQKTDDFDIFCGRVNDTFEWYTNKLNRDRFISPSFAVIQSSGMGKTRLLKEYQSHCQTNEDDTTAILILCKRKHSATPPDFNKHYQGFLNIEKERDEDALRNSIYQDMERLIQSNNSAKKTRVVVMLDEAQILTRVDEGRPFVHLRWWLRIKRKKLQIVAVFAGTTSKLSNFHRYWAPTGNSRSAKKKYINYIEGTPEEEQPMDLYAPFFHFTTGALFHKKANDDPTSDCQLQDWRTCGFYGRPLFAIMLLPPQDDVGSNNHVHLKLQQADLLPTQDGRNIIVSQPLCNILNRMQLDMTGIPDSHKHGSILASRVQLGISASKDFVSNVTAYGYGNLVGFSSGSSKTGADSDSLLVGQFSCIPDPICAALAMGMMCSSWGIQGSHESSPDDRILGEDPTEWVKRTADLFSRRLFLSEKGNAGEVLAALYILLCADELRAKQNPHLLRFSVPVKDLLTRMNGGAWVKTRTAVAGPTTRQGEAHKGPFDVVDSAEINCIQVCRHYTKTHPWLTQKGLEFMYNAAVGCYTFPQCEAVDLALSIRVRSKTDDAKNGYDYHPFLVSIKCWKSMKRSAMLRAITSMEKYVREHRAKKDGALATSKALCLLVVIGEVSNIPTSTGVFPKEDAFATVCIPENERGFGIQEAVMSVLQSAETAEKLSSHTFEYMK